MSISHTSFSIRNLVLCFLSFLLFSNHAFAAGAAEEPSEFLLFMGRFHPLFVHLPIGFLIIAFLLECFSRLQRFHEVRHATSLVLLLGTISAVVAALLGYFLSYEGGYDEDALLWHQWSGIGVALTAAIAYLLKVRSERKTTVIRKAYFSTLSVSMLALIVAGHQGGNLTHGSEYLTQYMPSPMRSMAGLPVSTKTVAKPITNIQEAVLYTDIIHPIFEQRCINCHNPDKKKGDLLMHTFEDLMKGGEGGKILVAGKAAESALYKHIILPLEDDDHMPPKGKKQLTKAQIELIRWWIDEGASPDEKVAQAKIDEPVKEALAKIGVSSEDEGKPTGIFARQVPLANAAAIAAVKKAGFMVMPISQDNHYVQVKFTATQNTFGANQFNSLLALSQQIAWLDLSNTTLSDEGLKDMAKLPNLVRLRLDKTNIMDENLVHLKGLPSLEYLNLYNTAITDKGLSQLASLKNLKSLYLWQTQVSGKGVQALQAQIPGLTANTGWTGNDSLSVAAKDSVMKVVSQKK